MIRRVELVYLWDETDLANKIYKDTRGSYIIMPVNTAKRIISGNCPEALSELRCVLERSAHEHQR